MKLSNKRKSETVEDLKNISRRINIVADSLIDDVLDEDIYLIRNIQEAYSILSSKILANQKVNDKKFLSDSEVDDIISEILNKEN